MSAILHLGDCLEVMTAMEPNSIDTIICDPPYMLNFMGKKFDKAKDNIAGRVEVWAQCLRVAKPGATLLAFGGDRTHHRMMVAIEDAGWEIRTCIYWCFGSGFPKSHDISKAIDRLAGAEREKLGLSPNRRASHENGQSWKQASPHSMSYQITAPATEAAALWDGWGTGLKPAVEIIVMAMKPIESTFAENALAHGVAGLAIDRARVGTEQRTYQMSGAPGGNGWRLNGIDGRDVENARRYAEESKTKPAATVNGRWPANLILECLCDTTDGTHDNPECPCAMLDAQSGERKVSGAAKKSATNYGRTDGINSMFGAGNVNSPLYNDRGGASRFFAQVKPDAASRLFYVAKASKRDRSSDGAVDNTHPTCKPTALMRYLCRLTSTPTGGIVLDPFMGSGSTGVAAIAEGRDFVGIEIEAEYLEIARLRIEEAEREHSL